MVKCYDCKGEGRTEGKECVRCKGSGKVSYINYKIYDIVEATCNECVDEFGCIEKTKKMCFYYSHQCGDYGVALCEKHLREALEFLIFEKEKIK